MKHLKIFENFEETRDLFGLWHTITLSNGFELTGPSEYANEVEKIAKKINLEFLKLDHDNYSGQEKILASWKSTLDDYEYTYPEYRVAVLEHDPDGSYIDIYCGKDYARIEPRDEEEEIEALEDGNWWQHHISSTVRNFNATHIYDTEGEDRIIPVGEY